MERIKVLALDGAVRRESETRKLLQLVVNEFDPDKAVVELFRQDDNQLPLYDDAPELRELPVVKKFLNAVSEADAIILASPEYHGSMSGALKNALDWCTHVKGEFAGKVVGLVGGGGSLANSGANVQMMMAVRAMHGWVMPDVLLSVTGIWDAFDENGKLVNQSTVKRLSLFAEKLTKYGRLFRENRGCFGDEG